MSIKPRPLSLAWGLWFHFGLFFITIFMASLAFLGTFIDPSGNLSQRISGAWGRLLLWLGRIPVQVEGLERLSPGQSYVYAANHRSNFDIYVLISLLPGKFVWIAKESLFKIPIFGQAIRRMGSIPVDRSDLQKAIRSLNQAAAMIRGGTSTIVFPEGTRAPIPELLPFKKGVFFIAVKAEQPIVPVSISGTLYIQPRGTLRIRPGPVKVVISPPIHPKDFANKKGELMNAVRAALEAHYDPYFPYGREGSNNPPPSRGRESSITLEH
ncbi:MAG: 1-acyl-sn-glycerol-3-phosphate acyltransferase [Deltaproteobacteria bacterium]|nr:1-acyl-sn-glycerol-3-phosphate acyltransferase [Deltaproteobacteria bacterium]